METALVVWIEDQTRHNIPLSQTLIHSKAPTLFNSVKAVRSEEAVGENFQAREVGSWGLKEEKPSHDIKVQGETASANADALANYPEKLAKNINGFTFRCP